MSYPIAYSGTGKCSVTTTVDSQLSGHPCFERNEQFCAVYDNPAFDSKLECASLEYFEPMLRRLFTTPKNSVYREAAQKAGMVV